MSTRRTDLALEARELFMESGAEPEGIEHSVRAMDGFTVTELTVLDERGENALGKPCGRYISIELGKLLRREDGAFADCAALCAELLRGLLKLKQSPDAGADESILVVGLGNPDITPDAIGPLTADLTLVTAHLKTSEPELFAKFRPVYVLRTGVLGTTGLESAALVNAVCRRIKPARVICVDALAARRLDRVCRTVQLSDTGVIPGSGVGNSRLALDRALLGVPVLSVGLPTVVDAATLTYDLVGETPKSGVGVEMMVTPRDIDSDVRRLSRLTAYALNLALHDGLTIADIDMLTG